MSRIRSRIPAAVAAALYLLLPACGGDSNTTPTVPVEGTVTYKGKPLPKGTIQFVPENGRPAGGAISDGHFVLTTNVEGDGAAPGKHSVAVTAYEEVPATKKGHEPISKALLPGNYGNAGSSGISVQVPAGGIKDLTINLQ